MIFNGTKILFYLGTTTSVLTTTYQCPPTTIPCSKEPICYLTSEICDGKCDCLVHCDDEKDCSAYFFLTIVQWSARAILECMIQSVIVFFITPI